MSVFNTFLDTLPDPDVSIGDAGQSGGTAGKGFISVDFGRPTTEEVDRTIRGRVIRRRNKTSMWAVTLKYSEFTESEFKPVYSFLMQKQTGLFPFFVELPQYKAPKSSAFASYVDSNPMTATSATAAGITYMEISETGDDNIIPSFGDLFHVEDSTDSFHTKTYMVNRVETASSYVNPVTAGSIRIHFTPGLHRAVPSGANIVFNAPKMFVRQVGGVQKYNLNNEGLYEFSLQLEEVSY